MSMKALQKLDHSIDLGCCRAIQLTISNADRYPGTIALELVLIDTQVAGASPSKAWESAMCCRGQMSNIRTLAVLP